MRDTFIFYRSFMEAFDSLTAEEAGILYRAVAHYALNGEEPELTGYLDTMWKLIRPNIQRDRKLYENGSKGGRPKNQNETKTEPNQNQNETKTEPIPSNDKDKDKDKYKDKDIYIEKNYIKKRFVKPSIEEVAEYCEERHNGINAEKFCDFYEAKGWKIGNNPMKDWRAAVRTWERKNKKQNQNEEVSQQAAHNDEPCMVIPKSEREGLQRYMEERGAKVELSVSDYARIKMMCHGKKKAIEAVIGEICGWEKEPEDIMWSVQYMLDNQYHELLWD